MSTCRRMWTDRQIRSMAVDSVEEKEKLEVFEHIVDKDGHKRFIEGDITMETIAGVTQKYGKWSLSGTHLMIVLSYSADNATEFNVNQTLAYVKVPEWIFDKIAPIFASVIASYDAITYFADNFSTQSSAINVRLGETGHAKELVIRHSGALTLTANRSTRIEIDYLIDNE